MEDCIGRPIEQQFRVTMGSHVGLELAWTRGALPRLLLLVGLARVVWPAVGRQGEAPASVMAYVSSSSAFCFPWLIPIP